MYKKNLTHYMAKYMVDFFFYLSILCTIAVPFFGRYINYLFNTGESILIPAVIFLSGLCAVYILYNLKQMYKSLLLGSPFTSENVFHFKKMAVSCGIISLIYLVKCIIFFTPLTAIVVMIFMVGTLFCLTLKDLFKQAIEYKDENELTI